MGPDIGLFGSVPNPTEAQMEDSTHVREAFEECWRILDARLRDGRYKAMAKSHLEEGQMCAVKSIMREPR